VRSPRGRTPTRSRPRTANATRRTPSTAEATKPPKIESPSPRQSPSKNPTRMNSDVKAKGTRKIHARSGAKNEVPTRCRHPIHSPTMAVRNPTATYARGLAPPGIPRWWTVQAQKRQKSTTIAQAKTPMPTRLGPRRLTTTTPACYPQPPRAIGSTTERSGRRGSEASRECGGPLRTQHPHVSQLGDVRRRAPQPSDNVGRTTSGRRLTDTTAPRRRAPSASRCHRIHVGARCRTEDCSCTRCRTPLFHAGRTP
jgi:hypothetical protein